MPLIDTMAAMLDMRRPDDLTRGPLRPDAVRRLAKALYNVRVSGAGRREGQGGAVQCEGEWSGEGMAQLFYVTKSSKGRCTRISKAHADGSRRMEATGVWGRGGQQEPSRCPQG